MRSRALSSALPDDGRDGGGGHEASLADPKPTHAVGCGNLDDDLTDTEVGGALKSQRYAVLPVRHNSSLGTSIFFNDTMC